jgi:hypothetical protein
MDGSQSGRKQTGDRFQESSFPGSIPSYHRDDLSFLDVEGNVSQDLNGSVIGVDVLGF